jgi:long-chain acyl-CoA synthetase
MPEEARPVFARGRAFNIGGAALHPEVRDRFEAAFGVTLVQGFGSTEVMGAVAMERADRRAPWGSCGSVWPGAEELVRVVDDEGRDVPAGDVGEFVVHCTRATAGYWEHPDLTDEAFFDGEWFRMGDLGRIDNEGFVYLLDRKKDMIIRGGFNIYSAEIERVLNEHPAVAVAVVVGVEHERLGEVPRAYVVLTPDQQPSDELESALRATATERLGALKSPDEINFVTFDALPRNAMGKVLKRELRASVADAS